jgi:hypothetical protein
MLLVPSTWALITDGGNRPRPVRTRVLSFEEGRGQPTVIRAGQRAALLRSRRRAAVSTATSGTRVGSDSTVIRSVPA